MSNITIKGVGKLFKDSFQCFMADKVLKLSGSLAYYTIFSLAPMILVVIYLADLFWGRQAVEGSIYGQIRDFVGNDAAQQIQQLIRNASVSENSGAAAALGITTLVIGATTIFAEIQDSINTIWGLRTKPKYGIGKMLINRLLSFSVIISLGFLLLVSLVLNALLEALMGRLQELFPNVTVVLVYIVNLLLTLTVTTLLFGIIFKVLPDALIRWKDVLVGAFVTALLFMIGKFGITFYIGNSNFGSTYGAAGSMVVILVWVYYSSVILYFGAEFTKSYAVTYGSDIRPNHYAVWVRSVTVEQKKGSLKDNEEKKKKQAQKEHEREEREEKEIEREKMHQEQIHPENKE